MEPNNVTQPWFHSLDATDLKDYGPKELEGKIHEVLTQAYEAGVENTKYQFRELLGVHKLIDAHFFKYH